MKYKKLSRVLKVLMDVVYLLIYIKQSHVLNLFFQILKLFKDYRL